ncbi:hypothetical protein HYH03_018591 [Edaphochlamys debaryana]|uniref:Peptidase M11 gametolysin domain-containing protein n=1 Tax=Edaphochlamys debaryana TaxID=47281 RepID=A0A836BP84_9CHLO|nr:hypothetical protein HYH03_018591 [Edaphochlamys debaryana]|eukprot:KAG2482484.1 hypothetical protein HYH03_018591 [Edaphochlamys debaryana]
MGDACPGAAEMAWLGWASPAAGAGGLNSAAMPSGRPTVTWDLPATYLTGVGNYIRLVPDWMPSYTSNYNLNEADPAVARNVYLHVRAPGKADSFIDPLHAYKDNDMAAYAAPNRRIAYQISISVGTRALVAKHRLVIYTGPSFIGAQGAILPVVLCRYVSSDTECPTWDDVFNPKSPPPSPPPAPPPPPSPPPRPPPPSPPPPRPPPPSPPPRPPPPSPPPPRPPPPSPPPRPPPPSPPPRPPPPSPPAPPASTLPTAPPASALATAPVSPSALPAAPVSPSALATASSASALAAAPSAPPLAAASVSASARPTAPAASALAAALLPSTLGKTANLFFHPLRR